MPAVNADFSLPLRLVGTVQVSDGQVEICLGANIYSIDSEHLTTEDLFQLLNLMNGRTIEEITTLAEPVSRADVDNIVAKLADAGLIEEAALAEAMSGLEAVLTLEDITEQMLSTTIYRNVFWRKCLSASSTNDFPRNVAYGMVIENYHFLFRESYFDAPVLSYPTNTAARLKMNEFFREEYGHDEILLKALNSIGISREDLADTLPLPQTLGLCNALAYWAHNDPLFFFSTLGLLEGGGKPDSFLEACERIGMEQTFVEPVRKHAEINAKGNHGSLARAIYSAIPAVDLKTLDRLRRQTRLLIEIYDGFYSAVWEHYSTTDCLLRRVSEL